MYVVGHEQGHTGAMNGFLPNRRYHLIERETKTDGPGFITRCGCPDFKQNDRCVCSLFLDTTFPSSAHSPGVGIIPEFLSHQQVSADFTIDDSRTHDTIHSMEPISAVGRSVVVNQSFDPGHAVDSSSSCKLSFYVLTPFHGRMSQVKGVSRVFYFSCSVNLSADMIIA